MTSDIPSSVALDPGNSVDKTRRLFTGPLDIKFQEWGFRYQHMGLGNFSYGTSGFYFQGIAKTKRSRGWNMRC
jgi:hypothetical protein